jgi:GntR family transcriptional regulator/MocR family aminotransferase
LPRWDLRLPLDKGARQPLPSQIANAIAERIRNGLLRPGLALPGSRALARSLKVSRNTVFAAYQELEAEGWVRTTRASGTFVSDGCVDGPQVRTRPRPNADRWNRLGFDAPPFQPLPLLALPEDGRLKWDSGVPDTRLAPHREWSRALGRVLRKHGQALLDYARYVPKSTNVLNEALAEMLSATGRFAVSPDNIVVTRGSQMGLYLLAQALIRPGDVVAVDEPGYPNAWEVFRRAGARIAPIAVDESGLRVDDLERLLSRQPIRALFLTPHHQFPTTVVLSASRRVQLLSLAARERFAVIEDDFDHEFQYEGYPVLPLAASDQNGVVIYVGSLSKVFAPGVRLGYVVAPSPLIGAIRYQRYVLDEQSDLAAEHAVAELFEDGEVQRTLGRARRVYRARRDCLVELLCSRLGGPLEFKTPSGGMALWVRVDPSIDVEAWLKNAMRRGLYFRTGRTFFVEDANRPFMRLGFARWNEAELSQAVTLLAQALPRSSGRGRRRL